MNPLRRLAPESRPMKSPCAFSCLTACGVLALSILAALPGTTASAAPIVWGSAQNISGDSDVSTSGTLLYAYNFGLAGPGAVTATTVNGVEFLPFQSSNELQQSIVVGNLRLVESPGFLFAYDSFGSANPPYSGLSVAYKALLSQAIYASEPGTITVTLGGLTDGQDYSVQWWTNDSSKTYQSLTTASGVTNVTLNPNTTASLGGLGQYVIGTFTASGTSLDFELTGSVGPDLFNFPMISGLQIRAVPEPSTCIMALAGLACGGFSVWRRRKRA